MAKLPNNHPASQLSQDIEEFLVDRQARNLSAKTRQWYAHSLQLFTNYSAGHGIKATTEVISGYPLAVVALYDRSQHRMR